MFKRNKYIFYQLMLWPKMTAFL